jgi:TATA-box binding protein (TBP) (component of TFIID and TFIIIB)
MHIITIKRAIFHHFSSIMSIVNINYRGFIINPKSNIDLTKLQTKSPPKMLKYMGTNGSTLLVFASGKCRIMGCKSHISSTDNMFPLPVRITHIQSVTACIHLDYTINLYQLARSIGSKHCIFEPEIFPALRITHKFNPLCVNVFASGKVVVLGLKTVDVRKICGHIKRYIDCLNQPIRLGASSI